MFGPLAMVDSSLETTLSPRAAAIQVRFGVNPSSNSPALSGGLPTLAPGELLFVTGPSGSGKSSLLSQIAREVHGCIFVDRMRFAPDQAVIDGLAPWASLDEALWRATASGLGEPRLWVQSYDRLSAGEQFRARLARALALHARGGSRGVLLCDEFTSGLHRRLARAVAFNLRKACTSQQLSVAVAASQDDFLADLRPDAIVRLERNLRPHLEERTMTTSRASRRFPVGRCCTEPGEKRDYENFVRMHYRSGDELGFVDRIFLLRQAVGGEALGIVVYAHAALELALRNQATRGWFSRNPARVNRHLRVLRRLVIHPDVRGCGLGHYLVRRTLPMLGVDFVECLADMGEFNPVFEKAGMTRVGQYGHSPLRQAAIERLRRLGVDPFARDFAVAVGRNRQIRAIVAEVIESWYAGTTGGGENRPARQSPEVLAQTFRSLVGARPVYYLWRRARGSRCVAKPESTVALSVPDNDRKRKVLPTIPERIGDNVMNDGLDLRHGITAPLARTTWRDESRLTKGKAHPAPDAMPARRVIRDERSRRDHRPDSSSGRGEG